MIIGALEIAFHADVLLQQFTLKYFPIITLEDNALVKKELENVRSQPKGGPTGQNTETPDFVGITAWINTMPLSLEQLKGKVVLVDFWTYSCINCIRTLPYLKKWNHDYKDKGLVIVGVHTPEFEFEKNQKNVEDAVKRFSIEYPVAMDNDYKTWQNYNNHYWPAHYLIDQQGMIRMKHFGEGAYQETENAIRTLLELPSLGEAGKELPMKTLTPETYLGYARADAYQPEISLKKDQVSKYEYSGKLTDDRVGISGSWLIKPELIQSQSDDAVLTLNFIATHVYLVIQSQQPSAITVLLDEKPVPAKYQTVDMNEQGQIKIDKERMYDIIDLKSDYGRHKLTLQVPKGVSLYAFTFGA